MRAIKMKDNMFGENSGLQYRALWLVCIALSLTLQGCRSREDDVQQQLNTIEAKQPHPIPVEAGYIPPAVYNYSAQQFRSPFMPPSLERDISRMAGKHILPDRARPQQFLEKFSLESIVMKGTMKNVSGPLYALVQAPQGGVMRIQEGSYMGTDFGRVVSITPTEINLIEIVPNGTEGYVERPRSLVLAGSGK